MKINVPSKSYYMTHLIVLRKDNNRNKVTSFLLLISQRHNVPFLLPLKFHEPLPREMWKRTIPVNSITSKPHKAQAETVFPAMWSQRL
jgi:hypothetical protein